MNTEMLRTELSGYLKKKKESKNAFAKRLGIEQSSISKFLNGKTGIAFDSAMKILEDMGYILLSPKNDIAKGEETSMGLQEKVDSLIRERDALQKANAALEENVILLKQMRELEQPLEKNETPQEEGHERRSASSADIGVGRPA